MKRFNSNFIFILLALFSVSSAFSQAPNGYYQNAEGKSKKDLLAALNKIVGPHTTVSYNNLWSMYKTTDVRDNGTIWDMYSTSAFTPGKKQCGSYTNVGDCYNREHSFPKSWFSDASPMISEAYHIYPTDGKVNGQRSNYPYGECDKGTTLSSNGSVKALGKLGTSTFPGYSGTVFEPVDEYKGDFARSYFYMAAAYQDKISRWSSPMLSGNDYPCFSNWAVNLLLKWSREDPVSQKEINRNNAVSKYQSNRNPFIDYPELAEYIWGNQQDKGWTPGGVPIPTIVTPAQNQNIDFGTIYIGKTASYSLKIKGNDISEDLNISISDSHFTASAYKVSASDVNSANGVTISIFYVNSNVDVNSATIKISNSEVNTELTASGRTIDGIPAMDATNVSFDKFTANWTPIQGDSNYLLSVVESDGVTLLSGFPVTVAADNGSYDVTGLQFSHQYFYYLTDINGAKKSNVVSVNTFAPTPVLTFIYPEGSLDFTTLPGVPSEPAGVEIYTEYISEPITATASGNFEISLNKTDWSQTLTIDPDGENIYVRSKAIDVEGSYDGSIDLATETIDGADADLSVVVANPRSFYEDFETLVDGGYYTGTVLQGSACKWIFNDAGTWANDDKNNRTVRYGKTGNSYIAMAEDKTTGCGSATFSAAVFSSDGKSEIKVQYSTDGGNSWLDSESFTISEPTLTQHSVNLNIKGNIRLKLLQISGKRLNLDNVAISDYSSVVATTAEAWDIYPVDGGVKVDAANGSSAVVYSVDAAIVAEEQISSGNSATINLQPGIYIVTLDNARGKKIIVK